MKQHLLSDLGQSLIPNFLDDLPDESELIAAWQGMRSRQPLPFLELCLLKLPQSILDWSILAGFNRDHRHVVMHWGNKLRFSFNGEQTGFETTRAFGNQLGQKTARTLVRMNAFRCGARVRFDVESVRLTTYSKVLTLLPLIHQDNPALLAFCMPKPGQSFAPAQLTHVSRVEHLTWLDLGAGTPA